MADNYEIPLIMVDPHWVDRIPYPGVITEDTIRNLPDTPLYDDDIFIATYPKSGSFWLSAIMEAILRASDLDNFVSKGYEFLKLPIEFTQGYQENIAGKRPRIIRTHMRPSHLPKSILQNQGKVINIIRNPRDVAVSFYNFVRINTLYNYEGSWDTFFEAFMTGRVGWGSWYDYMVDWTKYKEEPNILFIKYEDLLKNPQKIINTIATFMDKPLDEITVNRIAEILSFKSMKANPKLDVRHETIKGDFLRKGVVGDWVNYFTPEQEQRINEMYQKFKAETGIEFEFQ